MAVLPFRRRKEKRFEALVRPHLDGLYRFAYRLTGQQQDAEDLVQDVLTKLFPKTDELLGVEQLRPWLNKILYRQFVDNRRRQQRQPDLPLSLVVDNADPLHSMDAFAELAEGPFQRLDEAQRGALVDACLASLPPDQRALLTLHDVQGWRQEEVARILDLPLGTVKSRLHRARANLRERLVKKLEPFSASERVRE